jgi:hypothetical protein
LDAARLDEDSCQRNHGIVENEYQVIPRIEQIASHRGLCNIQERHAEERPQASSDAIRMWWARLSWRIEGDSHQVMKNRPKDDDKEPSAPIRMVTPDEDDPPIQNQNDEREGRVDQLGLGSLFAKM